MGTGLAFLFPVLTECVSVPTGNTSLRTVTSDEIWGSYASHVPCHLKVVVAREEWTHYGRPSPLGFGSVPASLTKCLMGNTRDSIPLRKLYELDLPEELPGMKLVLFVLWKPPGEATPEEVTKAKLPVTISTRGVPLPDLDSDDDDDDASSTASVTVSGGISKARRMYMEAGSADSIPIPGAKPFKDIPFCF